MDLNLVWSLGFTITVATIVLSGTFNAIFARSKERNKVAAIAEKHVISDFSRGGVVQVRSKEGNLVRLTNLRGKESKLFQHVELQQIDRLGQPLGKPTLREGDFEDIVNDMAGIPEGSLAHGFTPEYPDPSKVPRETQALRKLRYLPNPLALKALPPPTMH